MNKGQIRAHFKALLNRSDCSDALADTFIDQALTRIQRFLRVPAMEQQQTYSFTSGTAITQVVVPANMLEIIDLQYDGMGLVRVPLHEMAEQHKVAETGSPKYFSREREVIKIAPLPTSGTLYLNYYAEFDELTVDSSENIITLIASDLLTYTALSYAADYFLDERGPLFEQKSGQFLAEIQEQANAAEQSGVAQVMRPTRTYTD
jgi:hypothetical protein